MSIQIIEERMKAYKPQSASEELHALKEIAQSIALSALARGGFFRIASFQGGTCLRICHGLNRFSEDLDFILLKPDTTFVWQPFLHDLESEFEAYDLTLDVQDRSKADKVIKTAFLKDSSFGKVLALTYDRNSSEKQVVKIKLEVDSSPPSGSTYESHFLDFPLPFSIVAQDLPSLFASKCHALLCRPYEKGRDWYDLLWYMTRKTPVNYTHLAEALKQAGPWKNQDLYITKEWLYTTLEAKIRTLDWEHARQDVENFLKPHERESLKIWSRDFFLAMLKKAKG